MRPVSSFVMKPQQAQSSNNSPCTTTKPRFNPDIGYLDFRCDTSKKRGVYVEKNPTMLPTLYEDGKKYTKTSPFNTAGKKQILSSLLEILSKRTTSTQYSDEKADDGLEGHEPVPLLVQKSSEGVSQNTNTRTALQIKLPEVQYDNSQIINTTIVSQPQFVTQTPLVSQSSFLSQTTLVSQPPQTIDGSHSCTGSNYVFKNKNSGIYVFKDEKMENYCDSESVCSCCSIETDSSSWINLLSLLILNQCNEDDTSCTYTSDDGNVTDNTLDRTAMYIETDDSINYINRSELDLQKQSLVDNLCETNVDDSLNDFKGQGCYETSIPPVVETLKLDTEENLETIDKKSESLVETIKKSSNVSTATLEEDNEPLKEQTGKVISVICEPLKDNTEEILDVRDVNDLQSNFNEASYGNTIEDLEVEVESVYPVRPVRIATGKAIRSLRMDDSFNRVSTTYSKHFRKSTSEFTNRTRTEYSKRTMNTSRSDYSHNRYIDYETAGMMSPNFVNRQRTTSDYAAKVSPTLKKPKKSAIGSAEKSPAETPKRKMKKKSKKIMNKKRLIKQGLVNSFKQELEKDLQIYEEPKNFYEALRMMAHRKYFSGERDKSDFDENYKTVTFDRF